MLVKYWMSRPVITVGAEDTVQTARDRIITHDIFALPVVRAGRLVGLVSEAELYRASTQGEFDLPVVGLSAAIASKPVETVMRPSPPTVSPGYTMEEAADIMLKKRVKTLTVVDSQESPVGVVTRSDVLKVIIALTGVARKGVQYALQVEDRPRSILEITDTIRTYGGRMISILTSNTGVPTGYRKAYIRMCGIDRFNLRRLNDALAQKFDVIYVLEKLEIRRETGG
jgi:acetoin utilization protein AcuB